MILMDVNILVYAHREDTPDHPAYRDWVEDTINSGSAYGVSELVLSGFIRVVTHPKVFERPTPLAVALDFVNQIRSQPHAVPIRPSPRHWAMDVCKSHKDGESFSPRYGLDNRAVWSGCAYLVPDAPP